MIILLMGVSGVGKTVVGEALAQILSWRFVDADDFHSPANVAKMHAGIPLDDADRARLGCNRCTKPSRAGSQHTNRWCWPVPL